MSVIDSGITRDGYNQLRRRWVASSPRAVILIVHGMNEHSGRYEHVGEELAAAGFHVVAFDLRGHGMSGGTRSHVDDFEQFLDDVEDHLAELRKAGLPVVLLGHSMGGLIAARYAVSDRPQPDLLILSAPALKGPYRPPPAGLVTVLGSTLPTLRLPPMFGTEALSRDEEVQRAYAEDPLVGRRPTLGLVVEMFGAMGEVQSNLDRIAVPTMVVHGGDDRLVPRTASELLEDRSELRVYEGLRHEIFNEPEWRMVTDDVTTWLNQQLGY
jgi:acylglycerol lipase